MRRVVADRKRRLELSVQHRHAVEAVERDPGLRRRRRGEQPRDGGVGGVGRVEQVLVREQRAGAGERLRGDGLSHPRRPRCTTGGKRKVVLPDHRPANRDGPGNERRGEMRRRRVVLRRDLRVQLREVGEWVEDVAVIREEPIDGAVVALDVRVRPRERMRGKPLGVHRQGREERQRPRRRVGSATARRRRRRRPGAARCGGAAGASTGPERSRASPGTRPPRSDSGRRARRRRSDPSGSAQPATDARPNRRRERRGARRRWRRLRREGGA